jgi:NADH dehydrogenase
MSKRIVIIGGGFAGLRAAGILAKRGTEFQVFLIDRRREFTFSPWLIDALAGNKQPQEYTLNLAETAKRDGFMYINGTATSIDRERKTVLVQEGTESHTIGYDCLINCPGAKTAYYNIPGSQEHSLPLKTAEDVATIHAHVRELLKNGIAPNVSVVGAGPSGVEGLFAIRSFINKAAQEVGKPELAKGASLSLVQGAPQILPGFPNAIVDGAMRELGAKGARVYLGEPVSELTEKEVKTSKGTIIPANLVIWCAGIEANLVPVEPSVVADRAGYAIDRSLSIEPSVFSGGDAANYKESNVVIPKNAQTAMMMGVCLAENAARACEGLPPIHFKYANRGNLISLGDTGFLDLRLFCIKTALAPAIRNWFYKMRFKQMIG